MNDLSTTPQPPVGKTPEELAGLKNITMVVYGLQALSFLYGVTALVAIIINYVKRDDVRGTLYESHFDWQIRSFWWGLVWGLVGLALVVVLLGFPILLAAWLWMVYRVVKGWLRLNDGKPMYTS